jgi:hypothetical protein
MTLPAFVPFVTWWFMSNQGIGVSSVKIRGLRIVVSKTLAVKTSMAYQPVEKGDWLRAAAIKMLQSTVVARCLSPFSTPCYGFTD